ncbi:MAG: UDP-N-acetylmuramate dehydrogenase [Desulfobacteraceae bacterium]
MEERQLRELARIGGMDIRFDRPMRLYTTLRVGGDAAAFYRARRVPELRRMLAFLGEEGLPYLVVGKGSNLLVLDGGYDGVVIRLGGELASFEAEGDGEEISAGGGAAVRALLRSCALRGIGGLEFLTGIPGTVGGAVAMNAGSAGEEIGEKVIRLEMADHKGRVYSASREDLSFGYRTCSLPPGAVVTRVVLKAEHAEPEVVKRRMKELLAGRGSAQPLRAASAGSVFKNPPGDFAGRLMEKAGLKGRRLGGAVISPVHANFIINEAGAAAADILGLMELAREEVYRRSGVWLEPEIRIVGQQVPARPA